MTTLSPDQIAAKWAQNLGGATQRITDGINAVTTSPGQLAARQKMVWQQNTVASTDKWAARTAAVPVEQWKADSIQKGVPRIATGATAAVPKFTTFMGKLMPYINNQKNQLPARGTPDQNIARMVQFVRGMMNFSNSGS